MTSVEDLFPSEPALSGSWQSIYIEPVVGSGERISIAVAAVAGGQYKIIQSIRPELLDCLYGSKSGEIQSMISWIIESANQELCKARSLNNWTAPVSDVTLGDIHAAADENINAILKQGVRFSSSLSTLALEADREEDDTQPKPYSERWTKSIIEEMERVNPLLINNFKTRVRLSGSEILTTFGFVNEKYASNFGLLIPTRLSNSLNTLKARVFDLEAFKKSDNLIKPSCYEIIVGTPSFSDPTLTDKSVSKLKNTIDMVSEIAATEGIQLYRVETALDAARHINQSAA